MTRADVLQHLLTNKVRPDLAAIYADAYCEYQEAAANIAANGAICANPRTGAPMPNPYLEVRDRARQQLLRMGNVNTAGLW